MRQFPLCLFALSLWALPAVAQDQPAETYKALEGALWGMYQPTYAPILSVWEPISKNATSQSIASELGKDGWNKGKVELQLGTRKYDLFRQTIVPSLNQYLAVPTSAGAPPIQFGMGAPSAYGAKAVNANYVTDLFEGWSVEKIQEVVASSMQAGIDALCKMQARPSTINVKASAAGFVEVEAAWDAKEVCK